MGERDSRCHHFKLQAGFKMVAVLFCDPLSPYFPQAQRLMSSYLPQNLLSLFLSFFVWNSFISPASRSLSQPHVLPFKWYTVSDSDSRAEHGSISSDQWRGGGGPDCAEEATREQRHGWQLSKWTLLMPKLLWCLLSATPKSPEDSLNHWW